MRKTILESTQDAVKKLQKVQERLKKGDMDFEELVRQADNLRRQGHTPEEIDKILLGEEPITKSPDSAR